jgi:hypothetical protein
MYDTMNGFVDFRPSAQMNMNPSSIAQGNSPYSFVANHGVINNIYGGIFGIGNGATNETVSFRRDSNRYREYWFFRDNVFGSYGPGNVVSETYNQSQRVGYVNSVNAGVKQGGGRNGGSSIAVLGATTLDERLNGELYSLVISNIALSNADRSLLEYCLSICPPGEI